MATDVDNDPSTATSPSDAVIKEARRDFKRCKEWYGEAYLWSLEDTQFAHGDARNHWQWPSDVYEYRTGAGSDTESGDRPCLTINKTRTHNDICINEAMRNKSSIKIRATGGKASFKASSAMQSIVRRIEYISKATIGYRKAIGDQVDGGFGYVTLTTSYVSDRSFDQDIYIEPVKDPRAVYIDPDADLDGLNARYGFRFERMKHEVFYAKYPAQKGLIGKSVDTLGKDDDWLNENEILVAFYYVRKGTKDKLIAYKLNGKWVTKLESEIRKESGPDLCKQLIEEIKSGAVEGKFRDVENQSVKWYLIAGDKIIDSDSWAGRYIPIIPCWGRMVVIKGKVDLKGHTRQMIDAQRMLNYNASAFIEYGAMQTKTPYVGPARAFEGQEGWKDANRKNYAFLQYNDIDEDADSPELSKIERPVREAPPQSAPVYAEGMVAAERWMMMVSGQFQAQMGEDDKQSAASGRAINERQRQGDTATWHFNEGQADMFRSIGMQLIDLIPKIYDTERMLQAQGEDGTTFLISIKPDANDVVKELQDADENRKLFEFNPNIGEYDCMADPGPNYATQRQEAWNAISIILQQNMELAALIGDLLFRYGDFPGADEISERLRREIQATKPYLFNDKEVPGIAAAQQQMQKLQALNGELMQKMAELTLRLKGKEEKRDIEAFNAETKRMIARIDALAKIALTPAQQAQFQHELAMQGRGHIFDTISQANQGAIDSEAQAADHAAEAAADDRAAAAQASSGAQA